jgi:hypothetical protein
MALPLVVDGKDLPGAALDLITDLMDRLSATVALEDRQRREAHVRMSEFWMSFPNPVGQTPVGVRDPDGNILSAPINWRWKLWVSGYKPFPPAASNLVCQIAAKLREFLIAESLPRRLTPTSSGSASPPPAQLAIPLSWVRKTRG